MTTPTPEAIGYTPTAHNLMEAWEVPGKRLREAETQATSAIERQREAQRAVAQIKAEALREAAKDAEYELDLIDEPKENAPSSWLRARAATIAPDLTP